MSVEVLESSKKTEVKTMEVEQPETMSVEVLESSKKTEVKTMAMDPLQSDSSLDTETSSDENAEDNTSDDEGSIQSTESSDNDTSFKYKCDKCDLSFKFNCWFKRHISTHNPSSFACRYCPKYYKRKDILREHEYLHFGGKKHKCNECSKEFGDKRNLNKHVKYKHENSLLQCPKCKKMYSGMRQLRYHDNRMHSLKTPYKCGICNEKFSVPCLLASHRKKMEH
ncbi:zinc finger and BTB domain-containing protein 41-like isoform X3 [Aphis gossypii]|nr:zinc finger and BTB domain-containing protein 41-like isoform X3 [Aphis gossypii]